MARGAEDAGYGRSGPERGFASIPPAALNNQAPQSYVMTCMHVTAELTQINMLSSIHYK